MFISITTKSSIPKAHPPSSSEHLYLMSLNISPLIWPNISSLPNASNTSIKFLRNPFQSLEKLPIHSTSSQAFASLSSSNWNPISEVTAFREDFSSRECFSTSNLQIRPPWGDVLLASHCWFPQSTPFLCSIWHQATSTFFPLFVDIFQIPNHTLSLIEDFSN